MSWKIFSDCRDNVPNSYGGWSIGGESLLHGYSIQRELVGKLSWMQSMIFSATGKVPPENHAHLIEAMFIVTSYPDPRLWCNRVAALAGTARVPAMSALSVGIASSEARLYNGQATYAATSIIKKAKLILDDGGEEALENYIISTLKRDRHIPGFGRPLTSKEERIEPVEIEAKKLGVEAGDYLATMRLIEGALRRFRLTLNYAGYAGARLLDMGFNQNEILVIITLCLYNGMIPCYLDSYKNDPNTFLPIACEDILYEGVEERELP